MGCCGGKCENILFRNAKEDDFVQSAWGKGRASYIAFRGFFTLFLVVFLVWHLYDSFSRDTLYFTKADNWGYLLLVVYFIWALVLACVGYCRKHSSEVIPLPNETEKEAKPEGRLPWYFQVQWLLFNMSFTVAFFVLFAYNGLVIKGEFNIQDVAVHILNSVVALLDTLVCGIHVRLLHVVYPMCFGLLYVVFVLIYWGAGGTDAKGNPYVYSIIDFSGDPGLAAGVCVGLVFLAVPLSHLFVYLLYRLRCVLVRMYEKKLQGEREEQAFLRRMGRAPIF
ncbi:protein rolling stone-like [Branchiostoma lanceolatum]|uniref:protein rolling stone-like n=1 Tax=Branchiostoma lanceolatum TaxID=7740 RepID=UPI0034549C67